jgi:dipeptidase
MPKFSRYFLTSFLALLLLSSSVIYSQVIDDLKSKLESCTSVMVGRKASVDGSVMTTHACDGNYRQWVNIVPHKQNKPDAMRPIYWGNLHTETPLDMKGKVVKGEIPEVAETYSYMNVAYPCINEKQLAMGETTFGGKDTLRNKNGLFLIEELQSIALERCTTARDAIKLMGMLATKYGYGDYGECLTVADPKEVWHFEIMGAGPDKIGAVWAAVRIPDDHIGVSANICRISQIDIKDSDNYMASENVFELAKQMGFWKPEKEPFRFWKAYGGGKPFSVREFYIFNKFAPSLNLNMDMEELPFSVKPEKKVSAQDVMQLYRDTYTGTEFDPMKNLLVEKPKRPGEKDKPAEIITSPAANPWMNRDLVTLLNTLKPGTVPNKRLIPVPQCGYSTVIQVRDWLPNEVGGVVWFSYDNPAQSPRIPVFAGVTSLPKSFAICGQAKFRLDAASWAFRRANKLAQVKWGMTKEYINNGVAQFEKKAFAELPNLEERVKDILSDDNSENGHKLAGELVTNYTSEFAYSTITKWMELGDLFWEFFARGF